MTKSPVQQTSLQLEARPLPEPEATIWCILNILHQGHKKAIKMPDLAECVDLPTRALQDAIRNMRLEYDLPVGSTPARNKPGYFVIMNEEDLEIATRNLWNRGMSDLAVYAALKRNRQVKEQLGQLAIIAGR